MSSEAVYNTIGKTYDTTRKADPQITQKLIQLLAPAKTGQYLDVACGSGNYTSALFASNINICGVDISEEMLSKARLKNPMINWTLGDAKALPFQNNQFNGAICTLATHHIKNIEKAFQEIFRVLKSGKFVIFTSFPQQMENYWLNHYFPKSMLTSINSMHTENQLIAALSLAGFQNFKTDPFYVSNDLQDLFLQSGKFRPEIYLDPIVRSGISTFALEENQHEIFAGCELLSQDISSGKIQSIIESYNSPLGDYAFLSCSKC